MAAKQGKHSVSRAQGRRRAHASTKPAVKTKKPTAPRLPRAIITKRGKTTIRRYPGRAFHRFEEIQGKPVDYVEFFTMGEYHSLNIRFQDKTTLHFTIDPGFTLQTEYADLKTGDWRPIKRWPLIRSAARNS
jgi:hypothetical protein